MSNPENTKFLTAEEVALRIGELTRADSLRLESIGRLYAWGTSWAAADLLQEAMLAALERRRWRVDLSTTVFLVGVMRSLANSERKSERLAPLDLALAGGETSNAEFTTAAGDSTPEEDLAEDQAAELLIRRLERLFADDPQVLRVIQGRAAGEAPAAIKASLGLDQREYETVCRRLVRGYHNTTKVTQS